MNKLDYMFKEMETLVKQQTELKINGRDDNYDANRRLENLRKSIDSELEVTQAPLKQSPSSDGSPF